MRVLFISNRIQAEKTEILTWFQYYCEPSDLFINTNLEDARDFLIKQVIGLNKHIDFIITDWLFQGGNSKSILNWIRESNENYSSNNFQFRSIPVLLIEDQKNPTISEGFDGIVSDFPNNQTKLNSTLQSSIKHWRSSLADDLDLIGLDPITQKTYPSYRANFISYYKLKVLSRDFVDKKSKNLNYIWTNNRIELLNHSNDLFIREMRRLARNRPKYLEKEIHRFLIENPTFIKGEDYSIADMLYEKHLYKNGKRNYDEPDFMNKPHDYAFSPPEIFEVKRQSQKIISRRQSFIYNAKKSFEQMKRYKTYFDSDNPQNQYYIQRYLGSIHESYKYTLLMGSKSEKEEHIDLIDRLRSELDFKEINLLTYEELLERHVRLCNRMANFTIA